MTNNHFDAPSKPLIPSLGWKKIEELIIRQVNLTDFKCSNSTAPKYLCDTLAKNTIMVFQNLSFVEFSNTVIRFHICNNFSFASYVSIV